MLPAVPNAVIMAACVPNRLKSAITLSLEPIESPKVSRSSHTTGVMAPSSFRIASKRRNAYPTIAHATKIAIEIILYVSTVDFFACKITQYILCV